VFQSGSMLGCQSCRYHMTKGKSFPSKVLLVHLCNIQLLPRMDTHYHSQHTQWELQTEKLREWPLDLRRSNRRTADIFLPFQLQYIDLYNIPLLTMFHIQS